MEYSNPIILIHGSYHGEWFYINTVNYLNNKNYKNIYCYEFKGHGNRRDKIKKVYTINEQIDDLFEYLKNKKNCILISHSLGCYITHKCLEKYKNKLNIIKLFYLSPAIGISLFDFPLKTIFNMIFYGNFGNNINDIKNVLFYKDIDESTLKFCFEKIEKRNPTEMINTSIKNITDLGESIKIFLITSKNDKLVTFKKVKFLKSIFKNSEYKCFELLGHDLMLDNRWIDVCEYIYKNLKN